MIFTILGSGTSQGVPVIGCNCEVCLSSDKKDKRLRTAALISKDDINIAIDCGPDFREQMLRAQVSHLNAVLMTHEHSDHIAGIEDLRPFQFRQKQAMPVYATPAVQTSLKQRYDYAFREMPYPGAVQIDMKTIAKDKAFQIEGIDILPIELDHGEIMVLGFRIQDLSYLTDCKSISSDELKKVKGSRILILDALHHTEHHSHLSVREALEIVAEVKPEQAYFVHMNHNIGKAKDVNKTLPKGVKLAWDGLQIEQ
jgi:phosphoribosyl 1,2-cyclic phosphate phosphodiesterase